MRSLACVQLKTVFMNLETMFIYLRTVFVFLLSAVVPFTNSYAWEKYQIPIVDDNEGIHIVLYGKKYGIDFDNKDEESLFVESIVNINAVDNKKQIVEKLWDSSSRDAATEVYNSTSFYEGNRNYYKNISSSDVLFVAKYSNVYMFFVEHEVIGAGLMRREYPAVKENGKYYLTHSQNESVFYRDFSLPFSSIIDRAEKHE